MTQHYARNVVARALRSLRAEYNMNLEEVAKISEVNMSTISRYENGAVSQQIDVLEKILKAYGIDMDIFFKNRYANMQLTLDKK